MKKIEISCPHCDADYIISHDLFLPYTLMYCPFCGDMISEGEDIDFDEEFPDDGGVSDWYLDDER